MAMTVLINISDVWFLRELYKAISGKDVSYLENSHNLQIAILLIFIILLVLVGFTVGTLIALIIRSIDGGNQFYKPEEVILCKIVEIQGKVYENGYNRITVEYIKENTDKEWHTTLTYQYKVVKVFNTAEYWALKKEFEKNKNTIFQLRKMYGKRSKIHSKDDFKIVKFKV